MKREEALRNETHVVTILFSLENKIKLKAKGEKREFRASLRELDLKVVIVDDSMTTGKLMV